jgi:uncharacterized membrane protein YpjA
MNIINMIAIVLIIGGILGLAYGGFYYTRDIQEAKISLLELPVKSTQTVYIPVWISIAAMATGIIGGILLFAGKNVNH